MGLAGPAAAGDAPGVGGAGSACLEADAAAVLALVGEGVLPGCNNSTSEWRPSISALQIEEILTADMMKSQSTGLSRLSLSDELELWRACVD